MNLRQHTKAVWIGVFSSFVFALNAILVQQSQSEVSISESTFFRGLLTFLILLPWSHTGLHQLFKKGSFYLWIRALSGGVAVILYLLNTAWGSAAEAKALANISPLYVALLAYLFYRETLTKLQFLGLFVLASGGILLITQMHKQNAPWLIGFIGAFFTGVAYLSLKQAALRFNKTLVVAIFGGGMMLAGMIYGALSSSEHWVWPHGVQWLWLLGIGFTGLIGQITLTYSHLHLKNSVASALTLLTVIFLVIYEKIWTHNWPHLMVGLSYAGILSGVVLMAYKRKEKVGQTDHI
jgi:drug/metabolite transporter (DMT)-like permease